MVDGVSVILNPSLPVILSKAKDLIPLRVDSVKNLVVTIGCSIEILWLTPQNDVVTQSLEEGEDESEGSELSG